MHTWTLPPQHPFTTHSPEARLERRCIDSQTLMHGEREIDIRHGAQTYRLRVTALGKLILTK